MIKKFPISNPDIAKHDNRLRKLPISSVIPISEIKDCKLIFSFEILDLSHEYFNLGGTCEKWFKNMFEKLNEISKCKLGELISGRTPYRFHSHENEKISVEFPYDVEQSHMRQIRFGQSQGGIHGILIDNVFYVLWIDRHHNLYPNELYGGVKLVKPPEDCCGFGENLIEELSTKLKQSKEENDWLLEELIKKEELLKKEDK